MKLTGYVMLTQQGKVVAPHVLPEQIKNSRVDNSLVLRSLGADLPMYKTPAEAFEQATLSTQAKNSPYYNKLYAMPRECGLYKVESGDNEKIPLPGDRGWKSRSFITTRQIKSYFNLVVTKPIMRNPDSLRAACAMAGIPEKPKKHLTLLQKRADNQMHMTQEAMTQATLTRGLVDKAFTLCQEKELTAKEQQEEKLILTAEEQETLDDSALALLPFVEKGRQGMDKKVHSLIQSILKGNFPLAGNLAAEIRLLREREAVQIQGWLINLSDNFYRIAPGDKVKVRADVNRYMPDYPFTQGELLRVEKVNFDTGELLVINGRKQESEIPILSVKTFEIDRAKRDKDEAWMQELYDDNGGGD